MSPKSSSRILSATRLPITCLLLAGLSACDGQADSDYQGDSLAVVRGTITNASEVTPSDLEAKLVWINSAASPDTYEIQGVPVTGNFPANFVLDVFAPPPDAALNDFTQGGAFPNESRIGVAGIMALPDDLTVDSEEPDYPIGMAEKHVLVYVESDILPGTKGEEFLGEALPAGFYLMDAIDVDDPLCPGDVFDCLRRASDGMDTNVEVRLDLADNLHGPNWT